MPPYQPRRFEPLPRSWGRNERNLWVDMADNSGDVTGVRPTKFDVNNDELLRSMYHVAYFDQANISSADRKTIIDAMRSYMATKYDVNFDDVFDWEGYRENYDTTPAYNAITA